MRIAVLTLTVLAGSAFADTTELRPHVYLVDEGVDFELANIGADSFTFTWTDDSGTYADIVDPTILLVSGQTYTFRRTTSAHPFVITDETMPVVGTDGAYDRDTIDGGVIDNATLKPIEDFTADPAPTDDFIEWMIPFYENPTYYYTCRVVSHTGMTGRFRVVPPCYADYNSDAVVNTVDIVGFLSDWSDGQINADVNLDGEVNTLDVLDFLNQWIAGC